MQKRTSPKRFFHALFPALTTAFLAVFVLYQTAQATPVFTADATTSTPLPQMTPAAPLKLTFPAAAAQPVSSWRPPLFPAPFALSPNDHFYLERPIAVTSVNWPLPSYLYGYKDAETNSPHTGVDIDAPMHTPILAAGDGKVVFTGYGLALGGGNTADPYGKAVVIRHNFSYNGQTILTVYAHMEKIIVSVGQHVKTGDQIGFVGITGNTTGPHVHFEVRLEKDGTFSVQNPELWMVPPTDCGILVGQFKNIYGDFLTSRTVWLKSAATGKTLTLSTYATQQVRNDAYYQENLVMGDLPVGDYTVSIMNNYQIYNYPIKIAPGAITFIAFNSGLGFSDGLPAKEDANSFLVPYKK
jgi:Membrane proteins related to metalloendopeptidases